MKCLMCEDSKLQREEIDKNLYGFVCDDCGGIWIHAKAYWKWIKGNGHLLKEKPQSETADLKVTESSEIKICIDCHHFLTRRKIGHGIKFHIDRCGCCGGIWLDKNEWEVLKSRNLHDEIHFMFSTNWQNEVLHAEQTKSYEEEIERILGHDHFLKVKKFKHWLYQSSHKNVIFAYLKDKDV